jgi:hypothetical protein
MPDVTRTLVDDMHAFSAITIALQMPVKNGKDYM